MRIAIDIRCLLDGRVTGVEEYTINLIRALLKVAPQHSYHLFYNAARKAKLPSFGGTSTIHSWHFPNKIFNASQWALSRPRWDQLVTADCFFVPSLRLMPLSLTTPLVTTVHDLSFERSPEFFSLKRRLWHRMMQPRILLESSDHLIAVSHSTARDIVDLYGISPHKITVVYSGINRPPSFSTDERVRVQNKYALPGRFVLFMGTLEPRKNVPSIIRAFSAIAARTPHHLVIAGSRGWLRGGSERAIKESEYQDRIHNIGFVESADKMILYELADLFVYPSFYEGFGFPPLEALSVGTPVISSFNSSLPEVVGPWVAMIDPYDPTELAAVMAERLQYPQRLPAAAVTAILRTYSWERAARDSLAIIEQAA